MIAEVGIVVERRWDDAYLTSREGSWKVSAGRTIDRRERPARPKRLLLAAAALASTGAAFLVAATVLLYGTLVNVPTVATFFAIVALVLLGIAVLHFAVVGGLWRRSLWALGLGMTIAFVGTAIPGYIWFDQLTHSDDGVRVSTPYLLVALIYAAALISLLTSARQILRSQAEVRSTSSE